MHLCLFTRSFYSFSLALSCKKKKNGATNFCSLNSFHPATKYNSCSLSYPKKIILFLFSSTYWPIISSSSLVRLQESSVLYLSSLLLHSLILQLLVNWIFSYQLRYSLKCPRYISFVPRFSGLYLSSIFPWFLCFIKCCWRSMPLETLLLVVTILLLLWLLCSFFFLFVCWLTELSFTISDHKRGWEELPQAGGQGQRPRGATPRPR